MIEESNILRSRLPSKVVLCHNAIKRTPLIWLLDVFATGAARCASTKLISSGRANAQLSAKQLMFKFLKLDILLSKKLCGIENGAVWSKNRCFWQGGRNMRKHEVDKLRACKRTVERQAIDVQGFKT